MTSALKMDRTLKHIKRALSELGHEDATNICNVCSQHRDLHDFVLAITPNQLDLVTEALEQAATYSDDTEFAINAFVALENLNAQ